MLRGKPFQVLASQPRCTINSSNGAQTCRQRYNLQTTKVQMTRPVLLMSLRKPCYAVAISSQSFTLGDHSFTKRYTHQSLPTMQSIEKCERASEAACSGQRPWVFVRRCCQRCQLNLDGAVNVSDRCCCFTPLRDHQMQS